MPAICSLVHRRRPKAARDSEQCFAARREMRILRPDRAIFVVAIKNQVAKLRRESLGKRVDVERFIPRILYPDDCLCNHGRFGGR